MIEIKGALITLSAMLLATKPDKLKEADEYLESEIGLTHEEMDPNEYYDLKLLEKVFSFYDNLFDKDINTNLKYCGSRGVHTIQRTMGLPENLKTPVDYLRFEAEVSYLGNVKGVEPREFVEITENHCVIRTKLITPKYLQFGVWTGFLEIAGVTANIQELETDVYKISW